VTDGTVRRPLVLFVAVAALYAVASLPGHALVIPNVFVSPMRLSAGAVIAALTLIPTRSWWIVLLAMVPAHAWAGDPATRYVVALQYFSANAAEALVAALLLRRFAGSAPRLNNLKSCFIFLAAAVVAGPLVGATIGAPAVIRRDLTVSAFSTWQIWAFADAVGNLVIVPVCLAAADWYWRFRTKMTTSVSAPRAFEAVALSTGILLTTAPGLGEAALGLRSNSLSPLYTPFPLLVWASIRFGPGGAAAANLLLTAITILHALTAQAPFGQAWNVNSVLETQHFLLVAGVTAITLAALTAERWRAQEAAAESDERMRLSLQAARSGTWMWNFETGQFLVSDEFAALMGANRSELEQDLSQLMRYVHPDDREATMARAALAKASPTPRDIGGDFRIIRPDGTIVWFEGHGCTLAGANGIPNRAIGVVIDVSDRRVAQRERDATTAALMTLARSTFGDRGEIDEALRELTITAAETLAVERAGVWLFSEDRTRLRCVSLYERTANRHSSGDELAVERFPEYLKVLNGQRTLPVADTSTDPRTRELAGLLRANGIQSMLDAPLYLDGRLIGVFSFQHVGPPREWSLPARHFAGSMTDLVCRAFEAVERRKAEEGLHRAYDQLRHLARRLEAAKEDERRSIARELHDELGQSVTAIVISMHLVAREDREGRHAAKLKETIGLAEKLIDKVRSISLNLRPPLLDELGLVGSLRGYLEGQADQFGLEIAVDVAPPDLRVAPELEAAAFRIVQECLTNVVRHAAATRVTVALTRAGDALRIEVRDDGRGFDVSAAKAASSQGRHLGLLGLEERAVVLGGQVEFDSAPGRGTRVTASIPMQLAG
jgi:PAS domain S-box-containing protein